MLYVMMVSDRYIFISNGNPRSPAVLGRMSCYGTHEYPYVLLTYAHNASIHVQRRVIL